MRQKKSTKRWTLLPVITRKYCFCSDKFKIHANLSRWWEAFTAPRMLYRIALGMSLQSLQQLTGANYFFYYGTTIFTGVGIQNAFGMSLTAS
jgi:Sugar (and other) transporter